jgi:hypothetical protein
MPCRAHPPEAEALKMWNEDLFNEVVLAPERGRLIRYSAEWYLGLLGVIW